VHYDAFGNESLNWAWLDWGGHRMVLTGVGHRVRNGDAFAAANGSAYVYKGYKKFVRATDGELWHAALPDGSAAPPGDRPLLFFVSSHNRTSLTELFEERLEAAARLAVDALGEGSFARLELEAQRALFHMVSDGEEEEEEQERRTACSSGPSRGGCRADAQLLGIRAACPWRPP
jgi:hypothetical protein